MKNIERLIEHDRKKILSKFNDSDDIFFLSAWGNLGDELIYRGTKELLSGIDYQEINLHDLGNESGDVALIVGSGGWTKKFYKLPSYLPKVSEQFDRIIVLPSTYDIKNLFIRKILSEVPGFYFSRDYFSYYQIKEICDTDIALDCAFFF